MDPAVRAAFDRIGACGEDPDALIEAVCDAVTDASLEAPVDTPDGGPTRVFLDLATAPGMSGFSPDSVALLVGALGTDYLSTIARRPVHLIPGEPTAVSL